MDSACNTKLMGNGVTSGPFSKKMAVLNTDSTIHSSEGFMTKMGNYLKKMKENWLISPISQGLND